MKRIEEFVRTLPDDKTKRFYLDAKEQQFVDEDPRGFIKKDGNLVFPLDKVFLRDLKKLISIYEKTSENISNLNQSENQKQGKKETQRHKDLTLDRATLTLHYLFTYAKTNCHNTEKAKFIAFLTGYSENTIVQKLSTLHKKENENYIAYEKDLRIIRNYFEKLDLTEIIKMIDNDLESYHQNS